MLIGKKSCILDHLFNSFRCPGNLKDSNVFTKCLKYDWWWMNIKKWRYLKSVIPTHRHKRPSKTLNVWWAIAKKSGTTRYNCELIYYKMQGSIKIKVTLGDFELFWSIDIFWNRIKGWCEIQPLFSYVSSKLMYINIYLSFNSTPNPMIIVNTYR